MFYSIVTFIVKSSPAAGLQGGSVIKKAIFVIDNVFCVVSTCLLGYFSCGFLRVGQCFLWRILSRQKLALLAVSKEKPRSLQLCNR